MTEDDTFSALQRRSYDEVREMWWDSKEREVAFTVSPHDFLKTKGEFFNNYGWTLYGRTILQRT